MLYATIGLLLSSQLYLDNLHAPDNFKITIFASDVVNARKMARGKHGTIFVGTRNEGKVYALVDNNNDGKADKRYLLKASNRIQVR